MSIWDILLGRKQAVSKENIKKVEKFVVENINSPLAQAYLRTYATGGPWPRKTRITTLQKQGASNLLKQLYPFVGY